MKLSISFVLLSFVAFAYSAPIDNAPNARDIAVSNLEVRQISERGIYERLEAGDSGTDFWGELSAVEDVVKTAYDAAKGEKTAQSPSATSTPTPSPTDASSSSIPAQITARADSEYLHGRGLIEKFKGFANNQQFKDKATEFAKNKDHQETAKGFFKKFSGKGSSEEEATGSKGLEDSTDTDTPVAEGDLNSRSLLQERGGADPGGALKALKHTFHYAISNYGKSKSGSRSSNRYPRDDSNTAQFMNGVHEAGQAVANGAKGGAQNMENGMKNGAQKLEQVAENPADSVENAAKGTGESAHKEAKKVEGGFNGMKQGYNAANGDSV